MGDVVRLPTAKRRKVSNPVMLEATGNVELLPVETRHDVPVGRVLHSAAEAGLTEAVVIGYYEDGSLYLQSSSTSANVLWLLMQAQHTLFAPEE